MTETQRMRLKMRSNPNEDEGGQQPITVLLTTKTQARINFFPCCFIHIATLESEIEWERENQIVVPIPRQSVPMSPRNLKRPPINPN